MPLVLPLSHADVMRDHAFTGISAGPIAAKANKHPLSCGPGAEPSVMRLLAAGSRREGNVCSHDMETQQK
jgi:hypothetical protein